MGLPDVIIALLNGTLGQLLQLNDKTTGKILTGVSNGDIVAGTPFIVNSLNDAKNKGLAEATNAFAYKVVKEFYDTAPEGTDLYLQLVPDTMLIDDMVDKNNADGAVKLLDYAGGKIRVLHAMDNPAGARTITNGLDANVYLAKVNMQALELEYRNKKMPFWGILGGVGFNGNQADLVDQTASSDNRVSILIGDTVSGTGSCIGLLGGVIATLPVQRKVSRVKNGKLNTATAFIGTTSAEKYTGTATIHDKGYITLRSFPNKEGFFFSGDKTCTATTDDFNSGARVCIMNKILILAYAVFVEEVEDEVPINEDGTIDASYAKYLESVIDRQINQIMVANGELSSFRSFVDVNQNVLSTNKTKVVLRAVPVGYNTTLEVEIGFENPALEA